MKLRRDSARCQERRGPLDEGDAHRRAPGAIRPRPAAGGAELGQAGHGQGRQPGAQRAASATSGDARATAGRPPAPGEPSGRHRRRHGGGRHGEGRGDDRVGPGGRRVRRRRSSRRWRAGPPGAGHGHERGEPDDRTRPPGRLRPGDGQDQGRGAERRLGHGPGPHQRPPGPQRQRHRRPPGPGPCRRAGAPWPLRPPPAGTQAARYGPISSTATPIPRRPARVPARRTGRPAGWLTRGTRPTAGRGCPARRRG